MRKILIYGGEGWIGKKVQKILGKILLSNEEEYVILSSGVRVDDIDQVESELSLRNPTHVICLVGRTHGIHEGQYIPTIDYLEKPNKLRENLQDNLFCPLALAMICKLRNIHLTYMGTGCIFTYDDNHRVFSEEDKPNFFGSSYSTVKGFTDRLMHLPLLARNTLNVRIRMPISSDDSPRNFINKLLAYKKICSVPNSMTVLEELLPMMCQMVLENRVGTINLTNPGVIEHSEILDMYREIIDPEFQYTLFSYEDQKKVIACERSNNELDTQKLQSLFPEVKSIKESVRDVLMTMKRRIWNN